MQDGAGPVATLHNHRRRDFPYGREHMEAKPKNLSGFEAPDLVRSYLDLVQDADDVQELGTVSESATRDDRLKQNERDQVLNAIGARREQVVGPAAMATVSGFDNASDLLVQPEVGIEQAKKLWDTYKAFREYILKDDACADVMPGGGREMNRTGATRLAMPFGLSVQQIRSEETAGLALPSTIPEDDRKYFPPEGDVRYKKLVDVSKGRRHV